MIGSAMSGKLYFAAVFLAVSSFFVAGAAVSEQFGRFKGSVQVEWLDDGREMKTISEVSYIDPEGVSWTVPVGTKTDGASTPSATWSLYPPYAGKYRKAALIHDYFCEIKTRSWQDTHNMFYYALRASGMDGLHSKIMWSAVFMQGPRWDVGTKRSLRTRSAELTPEQATRQFEMLADWVRRENPSRQEIERAILEGNSPAISEKTENTQ